MIPKSNLVRIDVYNRISTGHEDNYNYVLYVEKIEIWKIYFKKT